MAYELDFLEQIVTRKNFDEIIENYEVNYWDNNESDHVIFHVPGIPQKYSLAEYVDDIFRDEANRVLRAMREHILELLHEESIRMYVNHMYLFTQGLMLQNSDLYNKLDESKDEERLICGNIDLRLSEMLTEISKTYSLDLSKELLKYGDRLNLPNIQWKKNAVDLIEIAVALHETDSIMKEGNQLTRKELYSFFEKIFNYELKDPDSTLSKAKGRKKEQAPFLEKLKKAFIDYCDRDL